MIIILTSVLSGISFAVVILSTITYLSGLALDKKLKEKLPLYITFDLKGITGYLFYFAERIGAKLETLNLQALSEMSKTIAASLKILGKPYDSIQPNTFMGVQILSAAGIVLFLIIVFEVHDLLLLLLFLALGFFLPLAVIKEKVKAKHKAIFRQLPDTLDLLALMVEAGLDFNAALNKILLSEKGELMAELCLAQQEIKLGVSRNEAFSSMAERLRYQPLTSVTGSLTNAFKTGGSLAPVLKTLAIQFRVERSQAAEKMAGEAPLKLMFPLVLFIFPTIFIIIFGPIALSFLTP